MQPNTPIHEIDHLLLTDLVQKALDRPKVEIMDWSVHPIHGGVEWTSAVFRFTGTAKEAGGTLPWSLILKTIQPTEKSRDQGGIWYWKREALAYQSGLLHRLPGGNVTAPACYQVQERADGTLWFWMEDIKDDVPNPWSLEQYALAARALGQFNGAYLTGHDLPAEPWIPRNWLRMYTEHAAPMAEFVRKDPHHPVVAHMFPGDALAQVLAVWDEHKSILDLIESLPQVFCHQDAFRRNLFARGGKLIAIDWGYMGNAAVGAELVALIGASLGFMEIPSDRVMEMDRLCFEGYLQGLRDAGWNGDPQVVRTGYVVTLMLRYPIAANIGEMLPTFLDQDRRKRLETAFENKTADQLEQGDPAIVAYYQGLLPEAIKLLGLKRMLAVVGRIGFHTLRLRAGKSRNAKHKKN